MCLKKAINISLTSFFQVIISRSCHIIKSNFATNNIALIAQKIAIIIQNGAIYLSLISLLFIDIGYSRFIDVSRISLIGGKSNNQVIYSKCHARGFDPWIDSHLLPLTTRSIESMVKPPPETTYTRHRGHNAAPTLSSILPLKRFSGTTVSRA